MKEILRAIMAFTVAGFISRCGVAPIAGGGTESTNGRIVGTLLQDHGEPATRTKVMLITSHYDPVKDGPVPDAFIDTTDEGGVFNLHTAGGGAFNIEAFQPGSGNRVLIIGMTVNKNDTKYIPPYEMRKPGAIKYIPSPASDAFQGYVYIPGTTRFAEINGGKALIDSVPAGFIPSIVYAGIADSTEDRVVAADLTVTERNTVVIANSSVWKYSKRFCLNTTESGAGVPGTVHYFPILIRLTSSNFDFSQAGDGGGDLRFIKEDGTPLPYEIERWDAGARQAEAWVNVDTVYGNDSAHSFMMCWGDSTALSASNGAAVFDSANGFAGVWHLGMPSNSIIPDATANGNNGTVTATATAPGVVGMAQLFDGSSSLIRASGPAVDKLNFQENGAFSVCAWVKTNVLDSAFHGIVYKSNVQYGLQMRPKNKWEFCTYIDKTGWEMSRATATDNTWHSLAGVRDGSKQYLYVDGVCADSSIALLPTNLTRAIDQPLEIGHCPDGGTDPDRYFNGVIDEVRVSSRAYNSDWVKLCYMNQKEQDLLVQW